jgi:hypothetical protein
MSPWLESSRNAHSTYEGQPRAQIFETPGCEGDLRESEALFLWIRASHLRP